MHFRYRRRKRVVNMVVVTESEIKEDLEVDMGVIMTVDMMEEA
jgi:hypothetical protein